MSLVATKFYDSEEECTLTVNLIDYVEEECSNEGFPHRATERGRVPLPVIKCTAFWWRVGGDVHVAVIADGSLRSTKATVRFPVKDFVLFQVAPAAGNFITVVGVSYRLEFICVRLEVSHTDKGITIASPFERVLCTDHTVSLESCRNSQIRSMSLVESASSDYAAPNPLLAHLAITNGFSVFEFKLFADGSAQSKQVAQFDGSLRNGGSELSHLPPSKVAVQAVVACSGLVVLLEPAGSVIVYQASSMTLLFRGTFPITGVAQTAVTSPLGAGVTRLVVGCSSGAAVVIDLDASTKKATHRWTVDPPSASCRLSSVAIQGSECRVAWSDCNLNSAPATLFSVFEGTSMGTGMGMSIVGISREGAPCQLVRWSSSWGARDAFVAEHCGTTIVLEADRDARVGAILLDTPSGYLKTVCDTPLHSASPSTIALLRLEGGGFSHVASQLLPARAIVGHDAFSAGANLIGQLKEEGLLHLQYLLERTLVSPAQFGLFAEFHYLRANAFSTCDVEDVIEADVFEAMEFLEVCEAAPLAVLIPTPRYTTSAVLQHLTARLMYLICVYIGWIAGPAAGVPSRNSTVTTQLSEMVEVTVGALMYVERCGVMGDFGVADLVNRLTQFSCGDVIGLVGLGAELTPGVDVASLQGGESWASALRHRHPVTAHFLLEAAIRRNDRSGTASATMIGLVSEVASALARMEPSNAAVVLERLVAPYAATKRPFWPKLFFEEIHYDNTHQFIETNGAASLYHALALRRLISPTNHSSCIDGPAIEACFLPHIMLLQQQAGEMLENSPNDDTLSDLVGFLNLLLVDAQLLLARAAIAVDDVCRALSLMASVLKASNEAKSETINSYVRDLTDHCLRRGHISRLCTAPSQSPQLDAMIVAHLLHVATSPASNNPSQREAVENGRFMAAMVIHDFLKARSANGLIGRLMYEIALFLREAPGATLNTPAYCRTLIARAICAVESIPEAAVVYIAPNAFVDHPLLRFESAVCDELDRQDSGRTTVSRLVSSGVPNRAQVASLVPMCRLDLVLLHRRLLQCTGEYTLTSLGHGVLSESWGHPGTAQEAAYNTKLIRELVRVHRWKLAACLAEASEQSVSAVFMSEAAHLATTSEQSSYIAARWTQLLDRARSFDSPRVLFDTITAALGACPEAVPPFVKQHLAELDMGALLRCFLSCGSSGSPSILAGVDELRSVVLGSTGLPNVVAEEGLSYVARYLKATNKGGSPEAHSLPSNVFISYTTLERWAIVAAAVRGRKQGAGSDLAHLVEVAEEVCSLVASRNGTK